MVLINIEFHLELTQEAVLKEYYVSGDKQISSSSQSTSSIASSSPKTILFWTPYYDRKDFTFGFGQEPFVKAGCKVTNCIATADRSLVNQSDAILFHALQFSKKDIPSHRLHHQRYVFYLYETIPNTSIPCIGKCLPAHEYPPDFFNWTMTHRVRPNRAHLRLLCIITLKRFVSEGFWRLRGRAVRCHSSAVLEASVSNAGRSGQRNDATWSVTIAQSSRAAKSASRVGQPHQISRLVQLSLPNSQPERGLCERASQICPGKIITHILNSCVTNNPN